MSLRSEQPVSRIAAAVAYGVPTVLIVSALAVLWNHGPWRSAPARSLRNDKPNAVAQGDARVPRRLPEVWTKDESGRRRNGYLPMRSTSEPQFIAVATGPEHDLATRSASFDAVAPTASAPATLRFPPEPITDEPQRADAAVDAAEWIVVKPLPPPENAEAIAAPMANGPALNVPPSETIPAPPAAPLAPGEPSELPDPAALGIGAGSGEWNAVAPGPLAIAKSLGNFTERGTITLNEVRQMALRNNKEIAICEQLPRITAAGIQYESAVFDPTLNLALNGGRYHRQTATLIQSMGANIPVLTTSFFQPLNGLNQAYVEKLFVSGAKAQIGVGNNFLNYSPSGSFVFVNPSYQPTVNLVVEQPLFRGRGAASTLAMTRIARANNDQSFHVFKATVNQVLRDAELAYWETYAAFQDFEARDIAFKQALQTVERERGRLQLGEGSIPDAAQAQEQYEMFGISRAEAELRLMNAQRVLRRFMGLPPDDPRPLIPATAPYDAPLEIDTNAACIEMRRRPEFAAQQAAVQGCEIEVARRRNGMLPDLSVRGIYSLTGLDDHYDQAWKSLGSFQYQDWTAGVLYRQPIGRRSDRALLDRALLGLAMEKTRLDQLELTILHQLDFAQQNVRATQQFLEMHARRRQAAALQLEARRELYLENRALLRDELDAELRYATALYDESIARVSYQRALTEWNFARGALADNEFLLSQ